MTQTNWEILRGASRKVRAKWWDDPNVLGVCFTKTHLYLNQAVLDILKADIGTLLMVFVDRRNDAFAIRTAREGEENGAYALAPDKGSKARRCAASNKLIRTFAWCKPGTSWKAELSDNMIVVRNNL